MFRRFVPLFSQDAAKMQTLFNLLTGKQNLKDQVPVKEASITRIFGDNWRTELKEWSKTLPPNETAEASKAIELYLKRIELTRYTRTELTDFGLFKQGSSKVGERAQTLMVDVAKERLQALQAVNGKEEGSRIFRDEIAAEGKWANWSQSQVAEFAKKVIQ
eukprot:TRINITY_DN7711_c0_g1_i2.p1 TRINITY_DN7711_c0_g1~~TRINITY_DN7711_c0_g1_i2.p1  ORF type:complete len:161 (+),score=26.14 TRINITY_DN7711_c0_g1_i2:60-542(+)